MPKKPLLSFVIPVYRTPPAIFEKCLDHLFDQSFRDFEVICVFDGPDVELEAVAALFKTKRVVIEHGGAHRARNEGFKHAGGRFISFWDSDCYAKPDMAAMWLATFERNPDAAFVYSGYEFANEGGAYDSEEFDLHSLQCGNFVASMFPVKRECVVPWDEILEAGQDWDFWLTIAEKGGKGVFIRGYGFKTEPSLDGSISFMGWSMEQREETIRRVREKHGIKQRDIAVYGTMHYLKALHIAKLLNADILKGSGPSINNYKLILNVGYNALIRFHGADQAAVKIQYWMPWDIDALEAIAHRTAKETIRLANKEVSHHFCNEIISRKRLEDLGITAEIVSLPTEVEDLETSLPDEFRVLVEVDKAHAPVVKGLKDDLPYIPIDYLEHAALINKYSLLVSFQEHPMVDEGMRRFLLNGRNIISNVQAPFCGFLDLEVGHPEFRRELFTRIRLARALPFNSEAQSYYKTIVNPERFKEKVLPLVPRFEVVQ